MSLLLCTLISPFWGWVSPPVRGKGVFGKRRSHFKVCEVPLRGGSWLVRAATADRGNYSRRDLGKLQCQSRGWPWDPEGSSRERVSGSVFLPSWTFFLNNKDSYPW